jgi:predicted GH43/DUF377 family glycosyl hydrolase
MGLFYLYLYILHGVGGPDAANYRLFKIYHKCMFIHLSISHNKPHVEVLLASSFDSKSWGYHQVASTRTEEMYLLNIITMGLSSSASEDTL